jgi:BASS family bile acid:Na+ symporter
MTSRTLVIVAVFGGIILTGVAVGCRAAWSDATSLFRKPAWLIRSMLSMNVLAPIVASIVAVGFDLQPPVKIALIACSVSPMPPFLPKKAMGAGGEKAYVIGLLVAASLLSIVIVPLALNVFEWVFGVPLDISPLRIARSVGISVLVPLAAGMTIHQLAPAVAARVAKPIGIVATVLLVIGVLAVAIKTGPDMRALVGNRSLVAMTVFAVVALLIGHALGGPLEGDRATLALSTASRHPGVPVAIASANFPNQPLVVPAVLMLVIVATVVSIPYLKWIAHTGVTVPGDTA